MYIMWFSTLYVIHSYFCLVATFVLFHCCILFHCMTILQADYKLVLDVWVSLNLLPGIMLFWPFFCFLLNNCGEVGELLTFLKQLWIVKNLFNISFRSCFCYTWFFYTLWWMFNSILVLLIYVPMVNSEKLYIVMRWLPMVLAI